MTTTGREPQTHGAPMTRPRPPIPPLTRRLTALLALAPVLATVSPARSADGPPTAGPLTPARASRAAVVIESFGDHLDFRVGDELVTRYHVGVAVAKPYCWPLNAPGGIPLTRDWPMVKRAPAAAEPAGTGRPAAKAPPVHTTDHVHQKSLWFCHGDVTQLGIEPDPKSKGVEGVDFWSEQPGHGRIFCTRVDAPVMEPGRASVSTRNEWRTAGGFKVLDETRVIRLVDLGDARLLVFDIDLRPGPVPVVFGDTKEGAFGVRVRDDLREAGGNGRIENAEGKRGEPGCWGRRSDWCDYSGPVDGQTVGIAVFADPANPVPTCWHVRGYGLMAANPFGRGKSGFPATKGQTALVTLRAGDRLSLRYAVLLHRGDAAGGEVARRFKEFAGGN